MNRIYKTALLLLIVSAAWGGDVAYFQNLGFSPNGSYFQFGLYGVEDSSQNPYAQIYTVDVAKNVFVPASKWSSSLSLGSLGDDGKKVLFSLLEKAAPVRKKLGLNFENLGRMIFVRVVSESQKGENKKVEVLDYQTGKKYTGSIVQQVRGTGANIESSFYIDLLVADKDGKTLTKKKVGSPEHWRKGVQDYSISQIILTPNEKGLVMVIERQELNAKGSVNIRYMVETLTF